VNGMKGLKLIDLSPKLYPGKEKRRLEIRHFVHPQLGTHMHDIDIMSHIGTHVEAPLHYFYPEGKDITEIPLETFIGECITVDLSFLSEGQPITPEVLEKVTGKHDLKEKIVLLQGPNVKNPPYLTGEAANWLVGRGIKMIGIGETIKLEAKPGIHDSHKAFLKNEVPILENLVNLEKLEEKTFLVALPLNIAGLESGLVRAVAISGLL